MKKLKIVLSIFLILVIIAGGYVGNMLGVFNEGNYSEYSLKNTEIISDSPISGKTVIFLGSYVTFGYDSLGVSFADYLEKTDGITATKEMSFGEISDSFGMNNFDTQTVAGAIEYIIAYAKEMWKCPAVLYTQAKYDSGHYTKMVDVLLEI